MANFSKFHKYQTFCLIELHNVSKGQLADKNFMKKLPGFKIDFEITDKVLPFTNIYDLRFLGNETTVRRIFFLKFAQKSVLLQMREILKPRFCRYF